jgi:excisionase family DNA binding protein
MDNDRLLTVPEVAERLRVHPDTLRRWLRTGRLRGVMMGGRSGGYRIKESEVARVASEGVGDEGKVRAAA